MMATCFPQLQDKAWLEAQYALFNTTQLAGQWECSRELVRRALIFHGIPRRHKGTLPGKSPVGHDMWHHVQQELGERYLAGVPMMQLAQDYGVTITTVSKYLQRQGIALRSIAIRNRHTTLDESVFDHVTEASAYWAGFLMGDGHCHQIPPTVAISLAEQDRNHVYALRTFLGSSRRIWHSSKRNECGFSIRSARLVAALDALGVTQDKSLHGRATILAMNRHWWRGIVDADGSLGFYPDRRGRNRAITVRLKLVGAFPLLEQFLCFVKHYTPACTARVHQYIPNMWECRISASHARTIIALLYTHCTVALPRKRHIAQSIFANQLIMHF